jgi:uncharacterized membrane protein YraQ (UPF0718 family)
MEKVLSTVREFWYTLGAMAPYLLFGFLAAGILSILVSPELVERHLGGHGLWPIFKASLFGVPLPLCSCSVIPVAASLRRHGSSKGATTAFLISTPQTGVDSILATFSLLGPVFAVFRPLTAFVAGVFGGTVVETFGGEPQGLLAAGPCKDECCCDKKGNSKFIRVLRYAFLVLPKDIAKPLLVGLLVAGGIAAIAPPNFFAETIGTGILAMLVMMALGIPLYVCATASIPVAAAMMMKGVTPGAALVFLMTGPATNAATVATLWKLLGRRAAMLYLLVIAITALGSGILLDYLFEMPAFTSAHSAMWMPPQWLESSSAVVLLIIIAVALIPRRHDHDNSETDSCTNMPVNSD